MKLCLKYSRLFFSGHSVVIIVVVVVNVVVCVHSKVKDVFNTIDSSGSGRLSCHDVRIPLYCQSVSVCLTSLRAYTSNLFCSCLSVDSLPKTLQVEDASLDSSLPVTRGN